MSNRAKFMLSVLFIVAIILCVGLTRFYFDVTKNTVDTGQDDKVESIVRSYGDLNVFRNANGYCGVIAADGTVLIEPEWNEVLDVTPDVVIVSSKVQDEVLIGGLDYDENIVIPFVYTSIEPLGDSYLAANVAEDYTVIVYDKSYQMLFTSAYDAVSCEDNVLTLVSDGCEFRYQDTDGRMSLISAKIVSPVGSQELLWRVSNQVYLSDLTENDLRRISRSLSAYMSMLIEDDFAGLSDITDADFIPALTRPGTMPRAKVDKVSGFSLTKKNTEIYELAFTAAYHQPGEKNASQSVQVHLQFRRGAENRMLLTSANLDFRAAETEADEE